jgi:hypothetical protein
MAYGSGTTVSVCLLWGPAAVGKTRLSLEFAKSVPADWVAGRLRNGRESDAMAAIMACGDPTLILVETPGWRPGRELSSRLSATAEN